MGFAQAIFAFYQLLLQVSPVGGIGADVGPCFTDGGIFADDVGNIGSPGEVVGVGCLKDVTVAPHACGAVAPSLNVSCAACGAVGRNDAAEQTVKNGSCLCTGDGGLGVGVAVEVALDDAELCEQVYVLVRKAAGQVAE